MFKRERERVCVCVCVCLFAYVCVYMMYVCRFIYIVCVDVDRPPVLSSSSLNIHVCVCVCLVCVCGLALLCFYLLLYVSLLFTTVCVLTIYCCVWGASFCRGERLLPILRAPEDVLRASRSTTSARRLPRYFRTAAPAPDPAFTTRIRGPSV